MRWPSATSKMDVLEPGSYDPRKAHGARAAAHQGLSAARRLRRRRRGDRSAIQHHRRLHHRQDRARDREVHPALRTRDERTETIDAAVSDNVDRFSLARRVSAAELPAAHAGRCCRSIFWRWRCASGRSCAGCRSSIIASSASSWASGCACTASARTSRPTLFVCNHVSYLDIEVLGGLVPGSFVAKAEVATWPFFSTLAKAQRTIFIERRTRQDQHEPRRDDGAARTPATI